jgi:hypothetical protein
MEGTSAHDPIAPQVPAAFQRWANSVFGSPWRAHELITGVAARDEVIERLVTLVRRREIRELRAATQERRSTASQISRDTIDPFAYSTEALRVASQYIAQCPSCGASGMTPCGTCRGSLTATCRTCGGTGKQSSPKTGRPINCRTCKKTGRVPCGACMATGAIACSSCFGSGHQLAWLTLVESEHWQVSVAPEDSLVVVAHRELGQARPLRLDELSAFSIIEDRRSEGPLDLRMVGQPYRQLPQAHRATVDPRLERIASQQYLRLAIVRRDVTYEMCGAQGTVALSGRDLAGATTDDAVRPIRRRLRAWAACIAAVAVTGIALQAALLGSSSYFDGAKEQAGALIVAAVALAIPALGAALRAWRGGARFHRLSRRTPVLGAGAALALATVVAIGVNARPTAADVQVALSSGNVAQARLVIAAMRERAVGVSGDPRTDDLDDRVMLAEAAHASGAERLRLLDAVASHHRAAAAEAVTAARGERLAQVQRMIGARDSKSALTALDGWFGSERSADVAEERARAHDAALAQCAQDACRLGEALQAQAAHPSVARTEKAAALRAQLSEALAVERVVPGALMLSRLQQLRRLGEIGAQVLAVRIDDDQLQPRARAAVAFAADERARVPLLRAERAVVEELLGGAAKIDSAARIDLHGTDAYLALDAAHHCTGIYAVGATSGNRALSSTEWTADRLLSQAVGKPVTVRQPSQISGTVQWYEGGYPVTARWSAGRLLELRIGAATP